MSLLRKCQRRLLTAFRNVFFYLFLLFPSYQVFASAPLLLKVKPRVLKTAMLEKAKTSLFIVQWKKVVKEVEKEKLRKEGVLFIDYIPQYAFLVKVKDPSSLPSFPFIDRWIAYTPEMKLAPSLQASSLFFLGEELSLTLELSPGTQIEKFKKYFIGDLHQQSSRIYWGRTLFDALSELAKEEEVVWLEESYPIELLHLPREALLLSSPEEVRKELPRTGFESGSRILGVEEAYLASQTGGKSLVTVADTGLDLGSIEDIHPDLLFQVKSGVNLAPGGKSWSDPHGHGTHVSGSIVGLGTKSDALIRGVAFGAKLHVQGLWSDIFGNFFPPYNVSILFSDAYDRGSRIHSNSWGVSNMSSNYAPLSKLVDEFIFQHPDFLVLFAAGNSGEDLNRDGVVDGGSISVPATAKNVIAVGASQNYILEGGIQKKLVELRDGEKKWGVEPLRSSYLSHNPMGMAAFSSRGPTADNRIKPDLVAPGTNIVSIRSRHMKANTAWGIFNEDYMFSGGTSMSTPLVSGFAAIIRSYLLEKLGKTSVSAALIKATLINSAFDLYPGQFGLLKKAQEQPTVRPNMHQGFGRVSMDRIFAAAQYLFEEDKKGLATGEERQWKIDADSGIRVTLVYTDAPGSSVASKALVNDLDLEVHDASGRVYYPNGKKGKDDSNNVENIDLHAKSPGTYRIVLKARNVPNGVQGRQAFALVISY